MPTATLPHLPDLSSFTQFGHLLLIVMGAAIALFGVGIYHGAVRFFGSLVGATFGFLMFLSNQHALPALNGLGPLVWGIVFSLIGGGIGAWLAELASLAIFFLLGCVTGYYGVLIYTGQWTQVEKALEASHGHIEKFGPQGTQWVVVIVVGLIYLMASNWILLITCAIVGAAMVANALNDQIYLMAGAPVGMLVQWGLYLRNGAPPIRRTMRAMQAVQAVKKQIIYDHGDDE